MLLNYKECHIDDFNEALKLKDVDVETISNEYLYVLYTKFKADAKICANTQTSYAYGVGFHPSQRAKIYKNELVRRGVSL